MNLEGKHAFVSAAAQGIGRAIVDAFVDAGATVTATDIDGNGLEAAYAGNDAVAAVTLDLRDEAALRKHLAGIGALDVLVNCVGWVANGSILDCSPEDLQRSMDTNVYPAFVASQAAIGDALATGRALSIINIASVISSVSSAPGRFAYGTSKAALIGMTKSIALDFIRDGVRCNAICPGTIATPSLIERMEATAESAGGLEAARRAFDQRQPIGRLGRPEEVAQLAVYLASDCSGFATGSVFTVDGGWSI